MTDAELHELIPLHALNALDEHETALVEAYLQRNAEAQATHAWYLEAALGLGQSAAQQEVPANLKHGVLSRIRQENIRRAPIAQPSGRTPRQPPRQNWSRAIPWAGAGIGFATIVGLWLQNAGLQQRLVQLGATEQAIHAILAGENTRAVNLASTDGQHVGQAMLARNGKLVIAHTLGKAAPGKTWQAWYIAKGESTPRPLETFSENQTLILVPENTQVIAISEEPAGGSQSPTTIKALGKVN